MNVVVGFYLENTSPLMSQANNTGWKSFILCAVGEGTIKQRS